MLIYIGQYSIILGHNKLCMVCGHYMQNVDYHTISENRQIFKEKAVNVQEKTVNYLTAGRRFEEADTVPSKPERSFLI